MCKWQHVRVWKAGDPTSAMANAASAMQALGMKGLGTQAIDDGQIV